MQRFIPVITAFSALVAAAIAAPPAIAQTSKAEFGGLTHAAVGQATLRLDKARDALTVHTYDPAGGDGVHTALPHATSWSAHLESTSYAGRPLVLSWHALADSRRISSASMRQAGDGFALSALFTGATKSTYSVQVYNDGRLVGALGGVPPTAQVSFPSSVCDVPEFAVFFNCRMVSRFFNTHNNECGFAFRWASPAPIRLPNGEVVTGNELRLVEEVSPAGHYPYLSFDGMVVQSNADLTILSESVR